MIFFVINTQIGSDLMDISGLGSQSKKTELQIFLIKIVRRKKNHFCNCNIYQISSTDDLNTFFSISSRYRKLCNVSRLGIVFVSVISIWMMFDFASSRFPNKYRSRYCNNTWKLNCRPGLPYYDRWSTFQNFCFNLKGIFVNRLNVWHSKE